MRVTPTGLKTTALNGVAGAVNGRYENGRVGVTFPEPFGVKALKPENLVSEASAGRTISVSTMAGESWAITGSFQERFEISQAIEHKIGSPPNGNEIMFEVFQNDVNIKDITDVSSITGPLTVVVTGERNFYADMWDDFDGQEQPNDVPIGSHQFCYWTDGIEIHRVKQADGSWKYHTEDDGR